MGISILVIYVSEGYLPCFLNASFDFLLCLCNKKWGKIASKGHIQKKNYWGFNYPLFETKINISARDIIKPLLLPPPPLGVLNNEKWRQSFWSCDIVTSVAWSWAPPTSSWLQVVTGSCQWQTGKCAESMYWKCSQQRTVGCSVEVYSMCGTWVLRLTHLAVTHMH